MAKEHAQLTGLLTSPVTESEGRWTYVSGDFGANRLTLVQCGIGKVNAALGAAALVRRHNVDSIISTGCAGGLAEGLHVMDVVAGSQTAYHDVSIPGCEVGQVQGLPPRFRADEQLLEVALGLHESRVHAGLICTGDQFITNAEQTRRISDAFPDALAVDMESAALAQTCLLLQVPFISFRTLSDTPGDDHHLQQYMTFWDDMAESSFEVTRRYLAALPERFALLPFEDR